MSGFRLPIIRELHRQLLLSPADVRGRYADRLERFLLELEPARTYPYEFVYFRIVGVRPPAGVLDTFTGEELTPDLALLLERLDEDARTHATPDDEKLYAIEDLRERFGVTARTIRRWRRRGLVSRRYAFPDGGRRRGVRRSALERFMEANQGVLSFSTRLRRLTDEEARDIVRRVAGYREQGLSTTAAAARVAQEVARAQETVRLVLKRRLGAEDDDRSPLTEQQRRKLLADYERGVPVRELAARLGRSASSIYRIINRQRARDLLARSVSYVAADDFAAPDAEGRILGEKWAALRRRLEWLPAEARPPGSRGRSLLSREDEGHLFRAYNFTKLLLCKARNDLDPSRYVPTRALRAAEDLSARAEGLKDLILRLHLSLVEVTVRQHAAGPVAAPQLLARGRALLGELIDTFDCGGRGRFAALVTLELQKAFARMTAERTEGTAEMQ